MPSRRAPATRSRNEENPGDPTQSGTYKIVVTTFLDSDLGPVGYDMMATPRARSSRSRARSSASNQVDSPERPGSGGPISVPAGLRHRHRYHHAAQGPGVPDREVATVDDRQTRPGLADHDSTPARLVRADEQRLGGRLGFAGHLVDGGW